MPATLWVKIFRIGFCLAFIRAAEPADTCQRPLLFPISSYRVQNVSIVEALRELRSASKPSLVTFGLEVIPFADEPEKNLSINQEPTTVGQILEEIIRQDPRYSYDVVNEHLIHVYPRGAKGDPDDLLNIRVTRLQISSVEYEDLIKNIRVYIPELEREILRRVIPKGQIGGVLRISKSGVGYPRLSLVVENTTVRDILNRIAQQTQLFRDREPGPTGWVYTFQINELAPGGGHPRWELF